MIIFHLSLDISLIKRGTNLPRSESLGTLEGRGSLIIVNETVMLALTYPDGARVQRCDYLPENPATSFALDSTPFELPFGRISDVNELNSYPSSRADYYASRFGRRFRRLKNGRKNNKSFKKFSERNALSSSSSLPSCQSCDQFSCEFLSDNDESTQEHPRFNSGVSSQSTSTNAQRLSIYDVDEESVKTRRRELPGRESWPGGRHPKDRCFLHLVLILVLIIIGSNRHCGPFGSRVNRTAFGVFAFGSVVGGVGCAPVDIITDTGIRSERSANLSHITGASRKIQMYIKHRHLQILPDGTVNGSHDDTSDFTVLQRSSVSIGQLRIQGVATCLYLCMDSCGLLYGSREFTEDCVFKETLEQHNYNTYSSVHWSTSRKTLYLGLSNQGSPRRVQVKGHNLGRLSTYARVLTQFVSQERVEGLHRRMLGAKHNVRHHHGNQQTICPAATPQEKDSRDKFRCRKRKKRKKRRRKCRSGETPGPQCENRENGAGVSETQSKRSCEGEAVEEACRREALETPAKKRKSRIEDDEDDLEEDLAVERKSRRSNATDLRDRGQRKKGKKSSSPNTNKKNSGKKKKNPGTSPRGNNNNNHSKNNKNSHKILKKRGNNPSGRFVRTTYRLSSSPVVTSPISWFPGSTSPTFIDKYPSKIPPTLSSSSSAVSAVSLAATSLASTLSLALASGEVFSEDGNPGESRTESILDLEEFDEEEEDREEEENDDDEPDDEARRTDFINIGLSKTETDQRLAM